MSPTDLKSLKAFADKVKKDNAVLLDALKATYGHRQIGVVTRHGVKAKFVRGNASETLEITDAEGELYIFHGATWDHHGTDILAVLKRADWTEDQITEIIEREEE